jgi:23S rRNA pseudouridine1911/1915/1917 synthase
MSRSVEFRAAREDAGLRLDAALARRPDISSRAAAQRLIDEGTVTVDGRRRPKSHRLARGERVVATLPGDAPTASDDQPAFDVVYEDDDLMVVDKPAGVVTHPARGHRGGTLAGALAGRSAGGPDPERAGIVHRLDRDTSGLLVVAKSEEAHARLQRMIRKREVRREYLALVAGRPDADSGTIEAPLGRDRVQRTIASTRSDRSRPALTHFRVVELLPRTTLLEVRLETGRTHQVRAHLAAIGHPVCGDGRYGGGPCGERLGLTRQFLHAIRLVFRHPRTGELVACESKPPADLCRAYGAAKREPVSGGPDGD